MGQLLGTHLRGVDEGVRREESGIVCAAKDHRDEVVLEDAEQLLGDVVPVGNGKGNRNEGQFRILPVP